MKKEVGKNPKYVDTVFNSIQPLTFPMTNIPLNAHNNLIPQVDFSATNLSIFSLSD